MADKNGVWIDRVHDRHPPTKIAIRGLMYEAALKGDTDPDGLSFIHAVRIVRRKLPQFAAIPPSQEEGIP